MNEKAFAIAVLCCNFCFWVGFYLAKHIYKGSGTDEKKDTGVGGGSVGNDQGFVS